MWHVWEREEVHTGLWWGDLREREYLEDLGIDGMNIKIFTKWYGVARTGFLWLTTGTRGGHL
jgi:hypothetical protein